MKKSLSLTFAGLLASQANPSMAKESMTIVVTSSRSAEQIEKSLAPVTVLTRDELESQQVTSMEGALAKVPGLSVSNAGGTGKVNSIFLRGTESDHVLVLIDGVRVGSVTSGTTAFQDIPVSLIDRIEVVRGPRSSLYGSEAIGGVIQIFTRRGHGETLPYLSYRTGRYDTSELTTGLQGGNGRAWFNLSFNAKRTNGFNSCDVTAGSLFGGCFTSEPDNDGYENQAISVRTGFTPSGPLSFELHGFRSAAKSDFDGSFVNGTKTVQMVGGASIRFEPANPKWGQISLDIGRNLDKSDNLLNGVFKSRFDSSRDSVSIQDAFRLTGEQQLIIGADYLKDSVSSTTSFDQTERENNALFALYQATANANDFNLSLRQDENEQFGGQTTGNIGWGYHFTRGPRFTISYGTAFKAPTFNELYFPGFSNPNLKTENARSLNLSFNNHTESGSWRIDAFQTRIADLISLDSSFIPANISKARIRGVELASTILLSQWRIAGHLEYLDARNRDQGPNSGNVLPRRPARRARVDVTYTRESWTLGSEMIAESGRYDDTANARRVPGYGIINLRAQRSLGSATTLQLHLKNALDKSYQTQAFYHQPGRGVYLTLRYAP